MKTKEWLNQYRIAKIIAERSLDDLDAAAVYLRSPAYTGMPRGGDPKDMADTVAHLERLRNRAEKARAKAIKLADEISEAIDAVPDKELRFLLWMRYVMCRNWYEVADAICVSMKTVHRMHGRALRMVVVPQDDTP